MEQPTEAQIKEFWEKLGYSVRVIEHAYHTSFDLEVDYHIPIPLKETVDLNNLFKYAVPKAMREICQVKGLFPDYIALDTLFEKWKKQLHSIKDIAKDEAAKWFALALFWALWQIKENT